VTQQKEYLTTMVLNTVVDAVAAVAIVVNVVVATRIVCVNWGVK